VERFQDIIFHVADFPGVSIFSPLDPSSQFDPLATLEFAEIDESHPTTSLSPTSPKLSSQDVLDWLSAKDELHHEKTIVT
jgi:hypothetical protein